MPTGFVYRGLAYRHIADVRKVRSVLTFQVRKPLSTEDANRHSFSGGIAAKTELHESRRAAAASPTVNASQCQTAMSYTCVTGIDDLEIDGTQYDMRVVVGRFIDLFQNPASQLRTFGDPAFAAVARAAIVNVLNTTILPTFDTTKFSDSIGFGFDFDEAMVHLPTDLEAIFGVFHGACPFIGGAGAVEANCASWPTESVLNFGVFSPSDVGPAQVPEPATALLLAGGLVAYAGTRRRNAVTPQP
jgi:hypothetical protein